MTGFVYHAPTEVVFGKDTEAQVGTLTAKYGGKKALILFGGGSVKRSGLLERVEASLRASGVKYRELGGVVPNPRLSLVYQGIALCRSEKIDFLLAVGGGSVIDTGKAIGYGAADSGDVWDFYCGKRRPSASLPLGTILTIAASGSEMSDSSVITNENGWIKRGCNSDVCRPVFSILNPELTMTLPAYQTACGCADILMHTMERYFNLADDMELTDGISEALMRTVIRSARVLLKDPTDFRARAEVMWAGSLSHNGLTGCGTGGGDWATHKLEHELSGIFDVAHGAGLTAVWGSWARFVFMARPDRFAQFAVSVWGAEEGASAEATALRGIEATEDFYRELNLPTSLHELGIAPTDEQIDKMAEKCAAAGGGKVGSVKRLGKEEIAAIYRAAR